MNEGIANDNCIEYKKKVSIMTKAARSIIIIGERYNQYKLYSCSIWFLLINRMEGAAV